MSPEKYIMYIMVTYNVHVVHYYFLWASSHCVEQDIFFISCVYPIYVFKICSTELGIFFFSSSLHLPSLHYQSWLCDRRRFSDFSCFPTVFTSQQDHSETFVFPQSNIPCMQYEQCCITFDPSPPGKFFWHFPSKLCVSEHSHIPLY